MTVRRTIFALTLLLLVTTRQSSAMLPPLYPDPPIHGRAIVGMLAFQDAKPATNGTPAAPAKALATIEPKWTQERTDLVDLAVTKQTLLQTRVQALQAEIAVQQKEANEVMKRANDEMVKACGLTTDKADFDFQKRLCVEKPKK